ncbi:MAG: transcriptional regulator, partial [Actinomycetota bacterium]|nr:transcriptional regulator [Actinomycetota bacterium]
ASLLDAGHLTGGDGTFDPAQATRDRLSAAGRGDVDSQLTSTGRSFLTRLGVNLGPRRPVIRYCVDRTEQRHHLAGPAARGLLDRLLELDWMRLASTNHAVIVTPAGQAGFAEHFGIDWPPNT